MNEHYLSKQMYTYCTVFQDIFDVIPLELNSQFVSWIVTIFNKLNIIVASVLTAGLEEVILVTCHVCPLLQHEMPTHLRSR